MLKLNVKEQTMKVFKTAITGIWRVENQAFFDDRGSFSEIYQFDEFYNQTQYRFTPVQWNQSVSKEGVIRGVHYSLAPTGQAKWISCTSGSILDVAVDLRQNSQTYLQHFAIELSPNNRSSLVIAAGIGHSFLALESETVVNYLLTSKYSPRDEYGISPLDPELGIKWPNSKPILSEKDRSAPLLEENRIKGVLPL